MPDTLSLHRQRGFTLIEMLVVMGIAGLVSGIAFPALERAVARQEVRLAANMVMLALRDARSAAIRSETPARFAAAPGPRLLVTGNAPLTLPSTITLQAPQAGIVFFDDGSSTGGTVSIGQAAFMAGLVVDAATGSVRVQ